MSGVTQSHWEFWMGKMPMPKDCDFETMMAMYDVVKNMEDREYAANQIKIYEGLWRKWLPKYEADNTLADIMKHFKEQILLYRKELIS